VKTRIKRLEKVLELAKEQRELVAYEDLDVIINLQQKREALLAGFPSDYQSRDKCDKEILAQILKIDRETKLLLAEQAVCIQGKIQDIAVAKEKLKAGRGHKNQEPQQLSCRV